MVQRFTVKRFTVGPGLAARKPVHLPLVKREELPRVILAGIKRTAADSVKQGISFFSRRPDHGFNIGKLFAGLALVMIEHLAETPGRFIPLAAEVLLQRQVPD